jgi:starch-binding outer membrane protein SusE/F
MKKIMQPLLLLVLLVSALVSCKKDEKKVFFEGGTAPVLQGSSNTGADSIKLSLIDQLKEAAVFSWTNPNYTFTTGLSSQDVAYVIEVDTVGSNFSSKDRKSVGLNNDLKYTFSQKKLNDHLTDNLNLSVGKKYNLEMRLISTLTKSNLVPLISNVVKFSVIPFQDPAKLPIELYITGDGTPSSWTNTPPPQQKFTYLGGKKYEIVMNFVPGKYYKFLTKFAAWQPQYGSASGTGGALGVNDGTTSDPPAIPTPNEAGTYKISVNLGNSTFTIVKQ